MEAASATPLSSGDALSLLLGAEGFLLAAVTLAVTLAAPNQTRQRKYTWLSADRIVNLATLVLALIAVGSGFAWAALAQNGSFSGIDGHVVGASLIVAIAGLPLIALALVLGSRRA